MVFVLKNPEIIFWKLIFIIYVFYDLWIENGKNNREVEIEVYSSSFSTGTKNQSSFHFTQFLTLMKAVIIFKSTV